VCFATGFTEAGEEGSELQRQLLEASGDMPLVGPNCYGLLNYLDGAMLWPDQQGGRRVEEGIALITMSSNVAFNLTMQRRGLPIAYLVSLGNTMKFDLHDAIRVFAQQKGVTALGLYLEAISDPAEFEAAVNVARKLAVPVVALKAGRSETAQKIVVSHTASLAGSDELMSALFDRTGVARVDTLEDLMEALKVLHVLGPLKGGRVGAMSPSGGDLTLIADAMVGTDLTMPSLSEAGVRRVRPTVHERIVVANPLDYQMFDWGNEERMADTFSAFVADDFDVSLCVLDYPREDLCDQATWGGAERGFIQAKHRTGAATAVLSTFSDTICETVAARLMAEGIAPLAGIDSGLAALQAAIDIGRAWERPAFKQMLGCDPPVTTTETRILDEAESKRFLAEYGVPVPESRVVGETADAVTAADEIGYPVAVKVLGISHKTDVGGVFLGLGTADAVETAVAETGRLGERFLVERMIEGAVAELIVGVARDEQFGPHLLVGGGGVLVELLKDSRPLLLPTTRQHVVDALNGLTCSPLFHGFRGAPKADLDAAADALLRLYDE